MTTLTSTCAPLFWRLRCDVLRMGRRFPSGQRPRSLSSLSYGHVSPAGGVRTWGSGLLALCLDVVPAQRPTTRTAPGSGSRRSGDRVERERPSVANDARALPAHVH
jgi:hypothetical protein